MKKNKFKLVLPMPEPGKGAIDIESVPEQVMANRDKLEKACFAIIDLQDKLDDVLGLLEEAYPVLSYIIEYEKKNEDGSTVEDCHFALTRVEAMSTLRDLRSKGIKFRAWADRD